MNTHLALFRLFEKLNLKLNSDLETWIEQSNDLRFETWGDVEALLFGQMGFHWNKKDEIERQWLHENEKIKIDLEAGIQFVCWNDKDYPKSFRHLIQPPLVFSFLGSKCWQTKPCISIVGSRDPHPYSLQWMKTELRAFLKEAGVTVVSGGARGVDFMAHSLCMDLGLPTLVVLPSGLKEIYPPSLKKHLPVILESGGCLLSEYDSNFTVRKHLFQHRNRLIAAMNHALLIVEARRQSGTMMTAHLALEIGRPVWVVPGHPLMGSFAGSLELIVHGAQFVRNAEDLKLFFQCELISYPAFVAEPLNF